MADRGRSPDPSDRRTDRDPSPAVAVGTRSDLVARISTWALCGYLAVSFVLIVSHFGADDWFVHDDWALITSGTGVEGMFEPFEEHWTTIPLLLYRALYASFGASYLPFLVTVAATHLLVVVLLWRVMLRFGVRPWIAALTAATLVLFGPGFLSILFPIQITQNLSIALGLTQLLFADHDGPIDRRDGIALLAGAGALMCSGLGPVMVVAVGITTLIRRGWRPAMLQTAPLAALFVTWFLVADPAAARQFRDRTGDADHVAIVRHTATSALQALGHFDVVALALAATLVGGLALRLVRADRRSAHAALAATAGPIALLVAAILYLVVIAIQRDRLGTIYAGISHHLYNAIALSLPALACGADEIARRWRAGGVVVGALLAVTIPPNIDAFGDPRPPSLSAEHNQSQRRLVEAFAHSGGSPEATLAVHVDGDRPILPGYSRTLTLEWVLAEGAAGRIAEPGDADAVTDASLHLWYGLVDHELPTADVHCTPTGTSVLLDPEVGDEILLGGPARVFNIIADGHFGLTSPFTTIPTDGRRLSVELPDLHLRIDPAVGEDTFLLCGTEQAP
jgi:hypothetical protein